MLAWGFPPPRFPPRKYVCAAGPDQYFFFVAYAKVAFQTSSKGYEKRVFQTQFKHKNSIIFFWRLGFFWCLHQRAPNEPGTADNFGIICNIDWVEADRFGNADLLSAWTGAAWAERDVQSSVKLSAGGDWSGSFVNEKKRFFKITMRRTVLHVSSSGSNDATIWVCQQYEEKKNVLLMLPNWQRKEVWQTLPPFVHLMTKVFSPEWEREEKNVGASNF